MHISFLVSSGNNSLINWTLWHHLKHALNSMLKEFWNSVVSETQANAVSNSVLQLLYWNATQAFSLTMHTGPLSSEWLNLKSDNLLCSYTRHDYISGFIGWLPVLVQTSQKTLKIEGIVTLYAVSLENRLAMTDGSSHHIYVHLCIPTCHLLLR